MLLMIILMILVLVVGTALDFAPTVLILTPVLMPIVKQAGIDPIYFGVLFIMNNAIGSSRRRSVSCSTWWPGWPRCR